MSANSSNPASPVGSRSPLRWVVMTAVIACVLTIGVTAVLVNIFEHKQDARNPFFRVVELTDETQDPGHFEGGRSASLLEVTLGVDRWFTATSLAGAEPPSLSQTRPVRPCSTSWATGSSTASSPSRYLATAFVALTPRTPPCA